MWFNYSRPTVFTALDLQSDAFHILQLQWQKNCWQVLKYINQRIDTYDSSNQQIAEKKLQALKYLCKKYHLHKYPAAVAISSLQTLSKRLSFPKEMTKRAIEKQIPLYLADYFIDQQDFVFDYAYLAKEDEINVEVFAARKKDLNALISLPAKAGIKIKIIDINIYAIARSAALCLPNHIDLYTVLHLKKNNLTILIIKSKNLIFSQELSMPSAADLNSVLTLVQENLHKTYRLIPFEKSCSQHILLAGDNLYLAETTALLTELYSPTCYYANPFENMIISSEVHTDEINSQAADMLLCCGLAMRKTLYEDD